MLVNLIKGVSQEIPFFDTYMHYPLQTENINIANPFIWKAKNVQNWSHFNDLPFVCSLQNSNTTWGLYLQDHLVSHSSSNQSNELLTVIWCDTYLYLIKEFLKIPEIRNPLNRIRMWKYRETRMIGWTSLKVSGLPSVRAFPNPRFVRKLCNSYQNDPLGPILKTFEIYFTRAPPLRSKQNDFIRLISSFLYEYTLLSALKIRNSVTDNPIVLELLYCKGMFWKA